MTILEEGALQLTLPAGAKGRRFDDDTHGLSHCMKAVDFVVETRQRILFIEFKDPNDPHATQNSQEAFLEELQAGRKDDDLVRKYRDSFLYQWAADAIDKPVMYYVLIASDRLDEAMLLQRIEQLQRKLPVQGPKSGVWKRQIVAACGVFNLNTWNAHLSAFPVARRET